MAPGMSSRSSKAEARYKDYAEGLNHCALCTMFRPPSSCTAVEGTISPHGVCKYFKAKRDSLAGTLKHWRS